ncbi:malectin domain-containing carbohydrate-binding protein [Aurantibacter sp.]|uniref:malectin domain-containing carbohydrate-binding protein n=1 Tax=Aurantibacter sp. TaxID=2807103 RepID=UPI0032631CC3
MEKFYSCYMRTFNFISLRKNQQFNLIKTILLVLIFASSGVLKAQLPTDFQKIDLVTNLVNATSFKFAPDGRIFIADRFGELIIYNPTTQTTSSAGTIPVFHDYEEGFLAFAFDPNYANNEVIYVLYSRLGESKNRLSQFTMNGNTLDLNSEIKLLDYDTQRVDLQTFHAGADMDWDSQGNLYIAIGDNTNHSNYGAMDESDSANSAEKSSSNTNDYRGKILRIKPLANGTYTIPSGNLFPVGTANTLPEIYVMGARNPYRIFVDKDNTDWLLWGEVGPDAQAASSLGPFGYDEINLTKSAGNYGWPYFTGNNEAHDVTYRIPGPESSTPFYNVASAPENISSLNTGLTTLPAAQPALITSTENYKCYMSGPRYYYTAGLPDLQRLPVEYDGIYLYYDFNRSTVNAVDFDNQGNIVSNTPFASNVFRETSEDGFLDMKIGPDDHLYVLIYGKGCCDTFGNGSGKLMRYDYTGISTNRLPDVVVNVDTNNGSLPLTVNFSSAGTSDPDGDSPLSYEWDFQSDGTPDSIAENPSFTYTTAGTFNAQLKVDDGNGGIGVANVTIYAGNNIADITYNSPIDGGLFEWGDDVTIEVTATDVEDGVIDCSDIVLTPSLGHGTHNHDLATRNGCTQTFTIEDDDSHDPEGGMHIWSILLSSYEDQGGLSSFKRIDLHPKRKEAEFFDTESGTEVVTNTDNLEGGNSSLRVDDNAYFSFTGRNLQGIDAVKYKVASTVAGGTIELRLGSSTGTLVSTTNVPNTGSLDTWASVETPITNPGGKNDLFFVFNGANGAQDIFDINYVEFLGAGVSIDNSPPYVYTVESIGSTQVEVSFSEYITEATAEQISNYSIDNGIAVSAAELQSDNSTVILTVSQLQADTTYNLTVSNVQNLAGLPMVTESVQFAIINAVRINVGGEQITYGTDAYSADQYFMSGSLYDTTSPIAGTTSDEIYQTERFGNFSYEIPIPVAGEYDIRLHFAELYFGAGSQGGGEGSRVFNVTIEGNPVLTNFDISSEVSALTALQKEFDDINITDGFASIQFSSVTQSPKLSAIEILAPDAFAVAPDIMITSPGNNWDVNQPFDVAFLVENWTIQVGDTHMHYFVDGDMISMHYSHEPITFDDLSLGSHTIRLELYNADHSPTGIFDEVTVNVTDQLSCNETEFPSSWEVHELDENPYTAVYTFAANDLDGDGLKDIVTGGWWYKNPGSASGNWQKSDIGGNFGNVAHVYDFDGDGFMDLLGTTVGVSPDNEYESIQLVWAKNDGTGNFTIYNNIPAGDSTYYEPFLAGIAGGDFGTGTSYQMAINWNGAESTGSPVQLLTPSTDPTTGNWTLVDISNDSSGEDIQPGDIDGDGDLDLFQGINWLENDGSGNFTTHATGITYDTTVDRGQLADFDRDGDLDAIVGQLGVGGSGTNKYEFAWFAAPADPTQPWVRNVLATDIQGSLSVFAIDFDFDGDKDVVVGEWLGNRRLIAFENDLCNTGTWVTQVIDDGALDLEHHDGARVVDIDNDGDLDVISNGWLNHLIPRIYENTTPLPIDGDPIVEAGGNQTVLPSSTSITLTGTASDPDGGTIATTQWTQVSGPNTATLSGDTTLELIVTDFVLGEYVFRLTATDDEGDTGFDEVTISVSNDSPSIRINSGGPAFTFNDLDWSEDQYNLGGGDDSNPIAIANTTNDELYQTERYHTSGTLVYEIPVTAGNYDVNLHFAEIYYGVAGAGSSGGVGSRVFNIDVEGQEQIANYDIIEQAGGSATAVIESLSGIVVNDGSLTITLTSVVENPKISGIEVLIEGANSDLPVADAGEDKTITIPSDSVELDGSGTDPDGGTISEYLWTQVSGPNTATLDGVNTDDLSASGLAEGEYVFRLTVTDDDGQTGTDEVSVFVLGEPETFRINSGGPELDFDGVIWDADQHFVGGNEFTNAIEIANTENDALYQTERFRSGNQPLIYEIPVTNGNHNVNLHFAEIYYGVSSGGAAGGAGSRVFNIDVEGQEQIDNYDIVVAAGGSATAVVENFTAINVTDGNLTITLTAVTDSPKISGIEVLETRPPSVNAGEDISIELPINNATLTGTAIDPDGGEVTYLWTQEDGPSSASIVGETTLELAISELIEGDYIFRLTVIDDENETSFDEITVSVYPEGGIPDSDEMKVILTENPAKDGLAKISVLNAPEDMEVLNIYLHDVGGRYIEGYIADDVLSTDGTYNIPIETLRDGLYFIGVGMNQGKPRLIKLLVDN